MASADSNSITTVHGYALSSNILKSLKSSRTAFHSFAHPFCIEFPPSSSIFNSLYSLAWIWQVGNCVTRPRLKAFLLLLVVFPLAFSVAIAPIRHVLLSHIYQALRESQNNTMTKRYWWDWPGSWVVIGGPPGRWIVGTILGFWLIQMERVPGARSSYPRQIIEEPHFRVVAIAFLCAAIAVFSAVSAFRGALGYCN